MDTPGCVSGRENTEPLSAIDAQIAVVQTALDDARSDLINSEQLVVTAQHVADRAQHCVEQATDRAATARGNARHFAHELDDLYTERRAIVPGPRPPTATS